MMTVHAIGLNYRHYGDFCIDRPYGSGDNLLVLFKTNAMITINGTKITAPPDSAILYSTGAHQLYQTCGDIYINHFLHFDCCETDDFHSTSGVPFNQLITMNDACAIEEVLRMISREHVSTSSNKLRYLDMLIKMLILKIADTTVSMNSPTLQNQHSATLNALRAEVYSNSGQYRAVHELAEKVSLSPSYFQQLYRNQFGVSCYEDLLTAKVKSAQYYLSSTNLSVKEISMLCGYENDICFMRCFKRRTGFTPMEYRNSML